MKASSLSLRAAVLIAVGGMAWGILMAISQDHTAMPAHAHLNLLGWVSLFLFGIFYHLHPSLDAARSAILQVWIWIVGTVILTIGVALVHSGRAIGDPFAAGWLPDHAVRHGAVRLDGVSARSRRQDRPPVGGTRRIARG